MNQHPPSRRRNGIALFVVLVVMAATSACLASVTFYAVSVRQTAQRRETRLQAEWLARGGVELAAARLLEKPEAFVVDNQKLLPDSILKIVVQDQGKDRFRVSVEVQCGLEEGAAAKEIHRVFLRVEENGMVRLVAEGNAAQK